MCSCKMNLQQFFALLPSYQKKFYDVFKNTFGNKGASRSTYKTENFKEDAIVKIVEVRRMEKEKRLRGKTSSGSWISLKNLETGTIFAEKIEDSSQSSSVHSNFGRSSINANAGRSSINANSSRSSVHVGFAGEDPAVISIEVNEIYIFFNK